MVEPLLRVEQVSKRFGGLLALDRASFLAQAGCITALIGPNGAGKTTLFSIIAGFAPPSAGRIIYDGVDITGEPPHRLARRGIARTFQIVQPFTTLSVRENIAVGSHLSRPARADALAAAGDVARAVGLGELLDRPAATLTVAGRSRSIAVSANRMAPLHGRTRPEMAWFNVDFPAPLAPSTATISPCRTVRSTPRRISVVP